MESCQTRNLMWMHFLLKRRNGAKYTTFRQGQVPQGETFLRWDRKRLNQFTQLLKLQNQVNIELLAAIDEIKQQLGMAKGTRMKSDFDSQINKPIETLREC